MAPHVQFRQCCLFQLKYAKKIYRLLSSPFIWFWLKHTTTQLNEMDVSIETQIIPKLLELGRIDPQYTYCKAKPLPLSRSCFADTSLNFSVVTLHMWMFSLKQVVFSFGLG